MTSSSDKKSLSSDACLDPRVPLDQLASGEMATVVCVDALHPDALKRLVSFGVVEGTELVIGQKGPFGCPIKIALLGSVLALRKAEAAKVYVRKR